MFKGMLLTSAFLKLGPEKVFPRICLPKFLAKFGWTFRGEFLLKPFIFVNKRPELFRIFLGRLQVILCYWKTFSVPDKTHRHAVYLCFQEQSPISSPVQLSASKRSAAWNLRPESASEALPTPLLGLPEIECRKRGCTILAEIITQQFLETMFFFLFLVIFSWSFSSWMKSVFTMTTKSIASLKYIKQIFKNSFGCDGNSWFCVCCSRLPVSACVGLRFGCPFREPEIWMCLRLHMFVCVRLRLRTASVLVLHSFAAALQVLFMPRSSGSRYRLASQKAQKNRKQRFWDRRELGASNWQVFLVT